MVSRTVVMTVVLSALPDRACNKCLKESHEFTCLLLAKGDVREWIDSNTCFPRRTFSMMASGSAVQTNGLGLALASCRKRLMATRRSAMPLNRRSAMPLKTCSGGLT